MRYFNTNGPIIPARHYHVPPLFRVDLPAILRRIDDSQYFVFHAPPQSGKTTFLLSLRDRLNATGSYKCVYVNVEISQAGRADVYGAVRAMLGALWIRSELPLVQIGYTWLEMLKKSGADGALFDFLSYWASIERRPLVLILDDIDALSGDSLISVLWQLREGFQWRPDDFPQSVILCGQRDVRDNIIRSPSEEADIVGGDVFDIEAESLRLDDFSEAETYALLHQHAVESRQAFTDSAMDAIWGRTRGQPWLVNALASEICLESGSARSSVETITSGIVLDACKALIHRHDHHLSQLAAKLSEDRVRGVVEPLLTGSSGSDFSSEDLNYARDLGLVARNAPLRIANPIYSEVFSRALADDGQEGLMLERPPYVDKSGKLEISRLLSDFQQFYRENASLWSDAFHCTAASWQLLLHVYLQRVIDGGGTLDWDYGSKRPDFLIRWPLANGEQIFIVECMERSKTNAADARKIAMLYRHMGRTGAESGHLVLFGHPYARKWEETIYRQEIRAEKSPITIWAT